MTPLTEPTRIVLSRTQIIPTVIGEPFGGGYFAGYISHTADGNPTHALIVAPRATGATGTGYSLATNLQWKTTATTTAGTGSSFDGAANTAAMVTAGIANHPAANFCKNLSIGGFSDWYLPARYEYDIAYFNLKPSTAANNTSFGSNVYSVPRRDLNNTATYPAQTALTALFAVARHGVGSPVAGHADNALIAGSIPARPLSPPMPSSGVL
jgi:hypothetical protein